MKRNKRTSSRACAREGKQTTGLSLPDPQIVTIELDTSLEECLCVGTCTKVISACLSYSGPFLTYSNCICRD
jgi:hypothetical protein